MTRLVKLEELALFVACIFTLAYLNVAWWYYLLLIIGPDISMLGYLLGNKVGAVAYNIFHHKAVAVLVFLIGFYLHVEWLMLGGIILFGHSCMDRFFGYGLKFYKGFGHTHLGLIGKDSQK
jgi:hypothetical protein